MDTQKINEKSLKTSAVMGAGAMAGVFAGRVLNSKTEGFIKNSKLRKGILMVAGALGTAMIKSGDTASKGVKSACVGVLADQGISLVKEFIQPTGDSLMAVGLGNPNEPIIIYDRNFNGFNNCDCNEVVDTDFVEMSLNRPSLEGEGFRLI